MNSEIPSHFPENERSKEGVSELETKSVLSSLLSGTSDPHKQAALAQVEAMDELALKTVLEKAAKYVSDESRSDQYHLGGNFLDEQGKPRNRKLMTMEADGLIGEYPFLKYVCLKTVPDSQDFTEEIVMHKRIQAAVDGAEGISLRIPKLVQEIKDESGGTIGIIMERLGKNSENASLQTMIESAKRDRIAVRVADAVGGEIQQGFREFHDLGFLHRDVNEGNVYLANAKFKDYALPKVPGTIRPSKLRIIFSADVILMDFEKAWAIPQGQNASYGGEIGTEDSQVRDMLDQCELGVDEDASLEEIIEANDDFFSQKAG